MAASSATRLSGRHSLIEGRSTARNSAIRLFNLAMAARISSAESVLAGAYAGEGVLERAIVDRYWVQYSLFVLVPCRLLHQRKNEFQV